MGALYIIRVPPPPHTHTPWHTCTHVTVTDTHTHSRTHTHTHACTHTCTHACTHTHTQNPFTYVHVPQGSRVPRSLLLEWGHGRPIDRFGILLPCTASSRCSQSTCRGICRPCSKDGSLASCTVCSSAVQWCSPDGYLQRRRRYIIILVFLHHAWLRYSSSG